MNESTTKPPLLAIKCLVYNHEPYLRQCLEGFVMQRTTFPYIAVVHDDASTDQSAAIIREYAEKYPDIIRPIYEEVNQYGKGTIGPIMDAAIPESVRYIAMCEGDDYWTDPDKLQRQVDFLEAHPEYSLCCHRYKTFDENTQEWSGDFFEEIIQEHPEGFTFDVDHNLRHWTTKTMTLVYRHKAFPAEWMLRYKYRRDVHNSYHLLNTGPGFLMPFVGAVYRIHGGGVFSTTGHLERYILSMKINLELYHYNQDDKVLGKWIEDEEKEVYRVLQRELHLHPQSKEISKAVSEFVSVIRQYYGLRKALVYRLKFINIKLHAER